MPAYYCCDLSISSLFIFHPVFPWFYIVSITLAILHSSILQCFNLPTLDLNESCIEKSSYVVELHKLPFHAGNINSL